MKLLIRYFRGRRAIRLARNTSQWYWENAKTYLAQSRFVICGLVGATATETHEYRLVEILSQTVSEDMLLAEVAGDSAVLTAYCLLILRRKGSVKLPEAAKQVVHGPYSSHRIRLRSCCFVWEQALGEFAITEFKDFV